MDDVNDDAKGGFRRIELLTGPGRRRRRSVEEKARVVEETLEPGARVSELARRWQVCYSAFPKRRSSATTISRSQRCAVSWRRISCQII